MSKSKWKILIEYDAVNIHEFEEAFSKNDKSIVIPKNLIKGIILTGIGDEMD